jgi:tetratricopeptide (TPR) repeat protein
MMRAAGLGALQHYYGLPVLTMVRFGDWDGILPEPRPPGGLPYLDGIWAYARALAYLRQGDRPGVDAELEALRAARADPGLERVTIWELNPGSAILAIAETVVMAEIAAEDGDVERAVELLEEALEIEDGLTYDEPPPWHLPVRQQLGAILVGAGQPVEAEIAYREDLVRHPENGWSLLGLSQALGAQGRGDEAAEVRTRFEVAWSGADVRPAASRY